LGAENGRKAGSQIMAERLKEILNKVLEWWNKFSTKQKTFIVSAGAGLILAFAILITILMKPQYVVLMNCENTKEAAKVTELLENEGLDYKVSDDAYQIKINQKQQSQASMLLAVNDVQAYTYTIDNVSEGGFSTTEADKERRYEFYMETRLANDLVGKFDFVESAHVELYIPENTGTLMKEREESSLTVVLTLKEEFDPDNAPGMAKALAVAVGNKTTENIMIMDSTGNTLFSGGEDSSIAGATTSQLGVKTQWEKKVKNDVRQVMLGTKLFDKVEVAVNLDVDFSTTSTTDHEIYVPDGNSQGYLSSERTFTSESTNESGEVPGTDSNGQQVEYAYQDGSDSNSSTTEEERKYMPSERITNKDNAAGVVNYDTSSISLTATSMNLIREEDVDARGELDGVTWEEYKIAHAGLEQVEVPQELYDVVAKATGFPAENIAIVAYSENVFFDAEGLNISASDIAQIVLIVVILALLAFVVLRSMRSEKQPEQPEELSVEKLLQSQPEVEMESLGMEQMSETRMLIEKFVDENPEAAANLLRNWLNEEWG
jgi:flagellar M-ring protein FliF